MWEILQDNHLVLKKKKQVEQMSKIKSHSRVRTVKCNAWTETEY